MTDSEKHEISRIHKRLDELVAIQNSQAISIARIAVSAEYERDAHQRPCPDHENLKAVVKKHIAEAERDRSVWTSAWIRSAVHIAELAGVGAFMWIISQ